MSVEYTASKITHLNIPSRPSRRLGLVAERAPRLVMHPLESGFAASIPADPTPSLLKLESLLKPLTSSNLVQAFGMYMIQAIAGPF